MISRDVVARVSEEILERGKHDWVDMSEVAWVAQSTGGAQTEDAVLALALDALRFVIGSGEMEVGDLRAVEGAAPVEPLGLARLAFHSWELSAADAVDRVNKEWVALGRRPNLGDVAWLQKRQRN